MWVHEVNPEATGYALDGNHCWVLQILVWHSGLRLRVRRKSMWWMSSEGKPMCAHRDWLVSEALINQVTRNSKGPYRREQNIRMWSMCYPNLIFALPLSRHRLDAFILSCLNFTLPSFPGCLQHHHLCHCLFNIHHIISLTLPFSPSTFLVNLPSSQRIKCDF